MRLSSLLTGLMFVIIVTRTLTPVDFGLYSLIGSLIAYSMFGHAIVSYWIPRHMARGEQVGKSGLFINGIFSILGTLAYLVAAYYISQRANSDFSILALGSILIPATYISSALDKINLGFKPEAVSYSLIIFEIAKIPLVFFLVKGIDLGLIGVIIATFFALLVKISTGLFFAWRHLKSSINLDYIKKWIKLTWLSTYDTVASNIYVLDTVLVSIFLKSTEPLAYFAAAMSISLVAGHSGVISDVLAPKLIADAKREHVKIITRLFTLFGSIIFVTIIVFAKPLLFLLNPVYSIATIVVYIQTLRAFIYGLFLIFHNTLAGIERVDTYDKISFSQYRKSNLFLLGTLLYVRAGLYIGPLIILLLLFPILKISILEFVTLWSLMALTAEISITAYSAFRVHKVGFLSFDWKPIVRYAISAMISGLTSFYIMDHFVVFKRDLLIFLPGLAVSLGVGIATYLVLVYCIDDYSRSLIKAMLGRKNES